MKQVIIGNGPAAIEAAETIRRFDTSCEIVMISKEEGPFYSPCPLAEYVEGSVSRDHLFLRDMAFYDDQGITPLFDQVALGIDCQNRQVKLEDSGPVDYDNLLIATGARVVLPPIPGLDIGTGVFTLKTLADADNILAGLEEAKRAVVIGSGFIGLEAAQALARRGLDVAVIEALGQILPQMLDVGMAARVQARLEENGIEVLLDSPATSVLGKERVTGVAIGDRELPCDMVVCATGVRPDLSIVAGSGIETDLGVLVDERMQTSAAGVFAAGDIVEAADVDARRRVLPTWPNAVAGGRVAGSNMAGIARAFGGLENINVVRIFDMPVASFGELTGSAVMSRREGGTSCTAYLDEGRLVGMQMVGRIDGMGLYLELMKKGRDVSQFGDDLLSPAFGYGRLVVPVVLPQFGATTH